MLGLSGKHDEHKVDPTTLPIFVHALRSTEAFNIAQKVWDNNKRYLMLDAGNHKELMRFVFNEPVCVVWLGRDQGRRDTFELVLMWDEPGDKLDVSEVYIISTAAPAESAIGDDTRVKSLLSAIFTSPSLVPVNPSPTQAPRD